MTLIEFQKKVKKDYLFDKVWNYIYSMMFLGIGIYFLFEIFFTDWSQNMTSGSVTSIVLMSFFILSIGIVGIIRTPKLAQIHKISINGDLQINKEKILEFSRQNKLHQLLNGKDENVLLFRTKKFTEKQKRNYFFS